MKKKIFLIHLSYPEYFSLCRKGEKRAIISITEASFIKTVIAEAPKAMLYTLQIVLKSQ